MIYFTGDTHGNFDRLSFRNFPAGRELTKDDYLIVLGDFGAIWDAGESTKEEKYNLKWLENRPFTILFLDGNHENFDRLNEFPVKTWHGGKIHEISPSIYHLMRGEIYDIEGYSFFVFGGARSHDIGDGILEPDDPRLKRWRKEGRHFRINHVSWWEQEMPTREEMEYAVANLDKHGNKVDYILTHCPTSTMAEKLGYHDFDQLTSFLEFVHRTTEFKMWYFGHMHTDIFMPEEKAKGMYKRIQRIEKVSLQ